MSSVERRLSVEELLGLTSFAVDKEPHIKIREELCERCSERPCLYVCPARLYTLDEAGRVRYNHEGCLECGACRMVCPHGSVEWSYPKGGRGVHYQYG